MITVNIRQEDEYIKLGQALKKAGLVESGLDAKLVIQNGEVTVNGEVEYQRGKKLHGGEIIGFGEDTLQIVK
jgi:ribosome-associated protein